MTKIDPTVQIPVDAVIYRGRLYIIGRPPSDDDEETGHNCDAMGCGSAGPHVLARIELTPEQLHALRSYGEGGS
jgi:hypothetical protein